MFEMIITRPLGALIEFIYNLVQNYGLAIIIFTVIIKIILLPLTIKSQSAMKKQQKIQPIIAELQKKYANDPEKLQSEMMKVYKDNNVSMAGGCLPMLIQMPILISLYQVIQKPLSFLVGIDGWSTDQSIIDKVYFLRDTVAEKFPHYLNNLATATEQQLADNSQILLAKWSQLVNGAGDPWVLKFDFLGMDLSNIPKTALDSILAGNFSDMSTLLLLSIPILAVVTTLLVSMQSQAQMKTQNTNKKADDPSAQMSKSMMWMMPIMTAVFTFTLPSGLGIYWIISNLMQVIQQVCINMYFDKKEDDFVVKVPEKLGKNSQKRK